MGWLILLKYNGMTQLLLFLFFWQKTNLLRFGDENWNQGLKTMARRDTLSIILKNIYWFGRV